MDKENLKLEIQKLFTKLRNVLNDKEDQLLKEIDNKYGKVYFNEELINNSEKLPNRVKSSLENGKLIENDWEEDNQNLNYLINPLTSPSSGAPALNYGDVNIVTPSPGEVKGLIIV